MIQPVIKVLLAGISVLGIAVAALTISPSSHDFGEVPVRSPAHQQFNATSSAPGNLLFEIAGPDARDFSLLLGLPAWIVSGCPVSQPNRSHCIADVLFSPGSVGPKRASLIVTNTESGDRVTAALKGTGVLALCTPTVVPCNYALHYSGVVSWSDGTAGVNVDVLKGVASCNATGESELTSGPGLVAVEFDESEDRPSPFYRVTVACPTRYPPEPARPAELGHGEFGSYKQALRMTIAEVQKGPPRLKGVEGEVSWNLCPNAQYVGVPRDKEGRPIAKGPHQPCPVPKP